MKTLIVVGALIVVGCKSKKGGSSSEQPDEFAAWAKPDAVKLWEGAWVTRMNLHSSKAKTMSMAGEPVALEIKGGKATVNGGRKEQTDQALELDLNSPCSVVFSEPLTEGSLKGGTAYHTVLFVIENGKLVVGSGAGGYRNGKAAIVCSEGSNGGVHLVDKDGTKCTSWEKRFGKLESKPDTCAWSQEEGKDVLTIGTGDWKTVVYAEGDVLASKQFREWAGKGYHKSAKDFADAKAQVAAMLKADDPGEQAKAEGGVVGKTDTVLSLIASYSADKSLEGKQVELTGLFGNWSSWTSNGKTTNSASFSEKEGSKFSLQCEVGETKVEGLMQKDKIVVKGTIKESFGLPNLVSCTVAKAP